MSKRCRVGAVRLDSQPLCRPVSRGTWEASLGGLRSGATRLGRCSRAESASWPARALGFDSPRVRSSTPSPQRAPERGVLPHQGPGPGLALGYEPRFHQRLNEANWLAFSLSLQPRGYGGAGVRAAPACRRPGPCSPAREARLGLDAVPPRRVPSPRLGLALVQPGFLALCRVARRRGAVREPAAGRRHGGQLGQLGILCGGWQRPAKPALQDRDAGVPPRTYF
jgi:hypothetical protein